MESWNSRIARIDALSNYKSFGDNCITDTSLNNFNTAVEVTSNDTHCMGVAFGS